MGGKTNPTVRIGAWARAATVWLVQGRFGCEGGASDSRSVALIGARDSRHAALRLSTTTPYPPNFQLSRYPGLSRPTRLTTSTMSSPRSSSPVNSPPATGSTTARPSSPKPPGGPAVAIRRKAAADRADKAANARPSSTRAAGAGGSSSTMLRLYTDESPGLKVDPVVVLVLSVGFIISVVALHVIAKITKKFSA